MATKSFLRTRAGQRIDQPDFERASDTSIRDAVEQLGEHFLTGSDTNRHYVLEGFVTTNPTGTTINVTGGAAVFGYRDRGEIRYGSLVTSGATSRTLDIGSFANANYTVYAAMSLADGEFGNRAFWDAALVTPAEVTRNVATRRVENWSIAVETSSPGAEWFPIATLTKNTSSITNLADIRELFFEGRANSSPSYSVTTTEWGTANDRLADRSVYGVKSLRKFVRAVQSQLSSIIGNTGWWSTIPTGANLTSLFNNKLARDGSQTMQGNLLPDGNSTRNLGASSTYWANLYATNIFAELYRTTALGRFRSVGNNNTLSGGGRTPMLDGVMEGTSPNLEYRIVYQNDASNLPSTSGPTIEIAVNAEWYYDVLALGLRWRSLNTGVSSYLYSFGRNDGMQVYRRAPTAALWTDTGWTLLHEMSHTKLQSSVPVNFTSGVTLDGTTTVNSATMNLNGTALSVTGTTSLATLSAQRATLSSVMPATPLTKTLYANMIPIARGTVTSNGVGGITAGGGLAAGTNFTVALNGGDARVTFTTGLSGSDSYQVVLTSLTTDICFMLQTRNGAYFDVRAFTASSGLTASLATNGASFDFVVIGG